MNRAFCWLILFVSVTLFAACSSPPPTAESTADIPDTQTNTPLPTNTSFPTNTPSPPPSPTETASPFPTGTSEPSAPELEIAYLDEDVFIWNEIDGIRQLTQTGNIYNFRLSPDGQRLAYLQTIDVDRTELRLVNADGSDDRLLVSVQDLEELVSHDEPIGIFTFNWHPDGEYLAFNTQIIGYGLLKNDDLHMVNIETRSLTTLLPPGQGGDFYFSPDGSRITLVTAGNYMDIPGKISLINTDGSNRHDSLITFPSVLTYSEYAFYPPLAWSPDSTFMIVAIPSPDPMAPDASITLWRIASDGSEVAELFTINTSFFLSGLPIFSPNLTKI
ncbi:MAG: PD40 domain-containing protein, partial [Anaerolineales bacterium]|nr:PD40 domain-containing protein [Anaerolineales bacterium]